MTARDCVFVVLCDDGTWDACCFDTRCGGGLHGLIDHVEHPTEADARKAATKHRAKLRAEAEQERQRQHTCPTCKQPIPEAP